MMVVGSRLHEGCQVIFKKEKTREGNENRDKSIQTNKKTTGARKKNERIQEIDA